MDIPDPIQRAKDRVTALDEDVAANAMQRARENREGGLGGRSLGFAVVSETSRGDGVDYLVLVTDGEQDGILVARMSGTLLSMLNARDEDAHDHLVERLQGATGSLPNDGNRFLNVILQPEPLSFNA